MWFLLAACTDPTPPVSTDPPATAPPPTVTETGDTGDTDTPVDTDVPTPFPVYRPEQLDCPNLPPLPTELVNMPAFGPHEDFAFDAAGNLVGVDFSSNLSGRNRQGEVTLLAPAIGEAKGTRYTADGSVVISQAEAGDVLVVHPDGQREVLASVPGPNGLAPDLHNNVWVASSSGALTKVYPDGTQEIAHQFALSLDGIAFGPDYRTLYVNSEFGRVHAFDLDDDSNIIAGPRVHADIPLILTAILDGMTTDACGNLYVARMDGRVFRVLPDGTIDGSINFEQAPGFQVVPAVNFGSGIGGFERTKLYAMNFLGGVIEADIGIEGRWEPHYPIPE